jgi:DNA-binding MarR family transcriptional regulator
MSDIEAQEVELHPLADLDRIIHSPARLMMMTYLYVVESVDFIFLMRLTGLTWGNLSSHLSTLEENEYVNIEKKFVQKKSHTMVNLTDKGHQSFKEYKQLLLEVLTDLPE